MPFVGHAGNRSCSLLPVVLTLSGASRKLPFMHELSSWYALNSSNSLPHSNRYRIAPVGIPLVCLFTFASESYRTARQDDLLTMSALRDYLQCGRLRTCFCVHIYMATSFLVGDIPAVVTSTMRLHLTNGKPSILMRSHFCGSVYISSPGRRSAARRNGRPSGVAPPPLPNATTCSPIPSTTQVGSYARRSIRLSHYLAPTNLNMLAKEEV